MKIQLADINPTHTLTINGDEPWLAPLYETFSPSPVDAPCKLSGSLLFELELAGTVKIGGHLEMNPMLPCGRCDKAVRWSIGATVKTRFYEATAPDDQPKDRELSPAELDAYFIEGSSVDAMAVIIDAINEEIPNYPVLLSEDGEHCRVCLDKVGGQSWEDPAGAEASPFAALKNLKTRH